MRFPFRIVHSLTDVQRNFEAIEQQLLYHGNGIPAFPAEPGAFYLRHDTPTIANQRLYVNTANGAHWTGIA